MKTVFTVKGVCVEPPKVQLNHKQVAGLTVLASKELQPLKAVFATEVPFFGTFVSVQPGDQVLVSTEAIAAQRWPKEVQEYGGRTFVVVPYEVITGVCAEVEEPEQSLAPTPVPGVELIGHLEEK